MILDRSPKMREVVRVRRSFVCYEEIRRSGSCSMKKIQINGGSIVAKRADVILV
jgi:hypothetical protein